MACICPNATEWDIWCGLQFSFKVAYYSFCTMRALIYARAAQGMRKHHACAKSREPAEEIPRAQKQNGGSQKNFLVFQVGFRGVLTVARLCLGLITKKKRVV